METTGLAAFKQDPWLTASPLERLFAPYPSYEDRSDTDLTDTSIGLESFDIVIKNDGTLPDLHAKVLQALASGRAERCCSICATHTVPHAG